jgi:iron(III) transport system permease protein
LPLAYLVWRAFSTEGRPSLVNFASAYGGDRLGSMAWSSLWFTVGSTALAVGVGAALAYVVVRTDVSGRKLLFVAGLAPLALPGVLYTIAWVFLAAPRSGILNAALGRGTLNVFSPAGMIVVEALHLAPIAFLLLAAAFRALDPALEESALAAGVPPVTVIRRITLPLVAPALGAAVLIVAIRAIESFEVPALIGIPSGVWLLTSRIWRTLSSYPPDLGAAAAYSLPLLALCAAGVLVVARVARRRRAYETITGRGFRPPVVHLGRWRAPIAACAWIYAVIATGLPLLALVYVSTQPFFTPPSRDTLSSITLQPYVHTLTDARTLESLWNSTLLGVGAATATVALAAVVAWIVLRTEISGRRILDELTFLPIAVPGLVLGLALLALYVRSPLPIYGTPWILLIAYATRFLPYASRAAAVSMGQVGRELEEAARVSGVGWWRTFRRVLLPLILPGLVAAWLYVFVLSLRELSSSILLYSPGNDVLAVRIWESYNQGHFADLSALGVLLVAAFAVASLVAYRIGTRLRTGAL